MDETSSNSVSCCLEQPLPRKGRRDPFEESSA
jgi:hypothetical protein